ncbi:MAG: extracellular solute-binding protein [Spirochaetaceae bacterium]|nr:MAG: extracellular solute-binding protein [Spirochaetaceae bacterium]
MKKGNHFLKAVFLISLFLIPGVWAQDSKRTIALWTFATNTAEEWENRKADIGQKFNINLKIEQVAQNVFVQKLQESMTRKKDMPDIIEWMIEDNRILDADPVKSFVLPLEEYTSISPVFSRIPAGRTAWVTYGQHVYGLTKEIHPVVLVYNDTLWKSVGVDLSKIKTWDEFFAAAKKLTAERTGGKPVHYALPYGNNGLQTTIFMIWQQTGADILDTSGRPQFTSREFTAFIRKWREWVASGAFYDWDWGHFSNLLSRGILASYPAPGWWVFQTDDAAREGKYQFRVRPLPVYREGGPRSASWGGVFMAIPKTASDPASSRSLDRPIIP